MYMCESCRKMVKTPRLFDPFHSRYCVSCAYWTGVDRSLFGDRAWVRQDRINRRILKLAKPIIVPVRQPIAGAYYPATVGDRMVIENVEATVTNIGVYTLSLG